jgi:hypothetical protein
MKSQFGKARFLSSKHFKKTLLSIFRSRHLKFLSSTGGIRIKQEQLRGYKLWSTTSSCTSGTQKAVRLETKHGFQLNKGTKQSARSPRSFYLYLLKNHILVIRGAYLARSIIENTCREGLNLIFRQTVDLWT